MKRAIWVILALLVLGFVVALVVSSNWRSGEAGEALPAVVVSSAGPDAAAPAALGPGPSAAGTPAPSKTTSPSPSPGGGKHRQEPRRSQEGHHGKKVPNPKPQHD